MAQTASAGDDELRRFLTGGMRVATYNFLMKIKCLFAFRMFWKITCRFSDVSRIQKERK